MPKIQISFSPLFSSFPKAFSGTKWKVKMKLAFETKQASLPEKTKRMSRKTEDRFGALNFTGIARNTARERERSRESESKRA